MTFDLQTTQALFCAPALIMKLIYKTQTQVESHLYLLPIKVAGSRSTIRTEMYSSTPQKEKYIHAY